MKLAGTRAHELQQEASLAIVLRIYRCDSHRTDARGGEETRTLADFGRRKRVCAHSGAAHLGSIAFLEGNYKAASLRALRQGERHAAKSHPSQAE